MSCLMVYASTPSRGFRKILFATLVAHERHDNTEKAEIHQYLDAKQGTVMREVLQHKMVEPFSHAP